MTFETEYTSIRGVVRVWKCDVCGVLFEWRKGSEWYGSWKDAGNHSWDNVRVVCSQECKQALQEGTQG